jgi:hypothetical protein
MLDPAPEGAGVSAEVFDTLAPLDRGVRLVRVTGQCEYHDDPSMSYRIHVVLAPPSFMQVAFIMLYGGVEEIIARAESLVWAEDFLKREGLEEYARFRRVTITGPNGFSCERRGAVAR